MNKNYDLFTKMKPKEMSKNISDMTYTYINPDTKQPTVVPASHYEKILNKVVEESVAVETQRNFLNIMYSQLKALKEEEPKYFRQALLCLELGINPKDMRVAEVIALSETVDYLEERERKEKKNFHLIDKDVVDFYNSTVEDLNLHGQLIGVDQEDKEDQDYDVEIKISDDKGHILN